MLKIGQIVDRLRGGGPCLQCAILRDDVEELTHEKADLAGKLSIKTRISGEYFALIESICEDRDRWRDMYRMQASEHLNAQVMLERSLTKLSEMLSKAVSVLNQYREKDGLAPIKTEEALASCVMSTSDSYREKMAEANKNAPVETDSLKARDEIASVDSKKSA